MDLIKSLESEGLRNDISDFQVGDTIRVYVRIQEAGKERTQAFEGICIGKKGGGMGESFRVRRISGGIGVERTFLLHSPRIEKVIIRKRGHVRRAKLNYLRARASKAARVKERRR